jgi:hypothetical protein
MPAQFSVSPGKTKFFIILNIFKYLLKQSRYTGSTAADVLRSAGHNFDNLTKPCKAVSNQHAACHFGRCRVDLDARCKTRQCAGNLKEADGSSQTDRQFVHGRL